MRRLVFLSFFCGASFVFGQEQGTSVRKLKKLGFVYNNAKQNNFLFSDRDYDYQTQVFKVQFFYTLHTGKKWDFNLIVQPQIQVAKHQLLNPFFITPDEANYMELRDHFTQERNLSLYAFELGFQWRRKIFHQVYFETTLGLGAGFIDKETERLAHGFTFIENLSVGLTHRWKSSEIYLGSNFGHVSNFNIQSPNSGYNILGFEIGYRVLLN